MLIEKSKSNNKVSEINNEINNDGVNPYKPEHKSNHDYEYNNDGTFTNSNQMNHEKKQKNSLQQLTLRLFSILTNKKHTSQKSIQSTSHEPSIVLSLNVNNSHNSKHFYRKETPSKLVSLVQTIKYSNLNNDEHQNDNDPTFLVSSTKFTATEFTSHPYFLLTTGTTTSYYSSSLNDVNYKNNELYSIFVSMFTAAIFVFFIMWRWIRMKSDLRKALREQLEIQRQQQQFSNNNNSSSRSTPSSTPPSTSSTLSPIRLSSPVYQQNMFMYSGNRENLSALMNQLSDGEARTARQNQQIIDTAKYCLQQLRQNSRQSRHNRENECLNNYYSFNSRYDRSMSARNSSHVAHLSNQAQTNCIQECVSSSSSILSNHFNSNELPPSYESLMTKSSSLPSYCHLAKVSPR